MIQADGFAWIFTAMLVFLGILLFLCLLRAVKGPTVADRLVAVNMMGTMVIVMIAILSVVMNEGYLGDIALIYAMISFISVVVLTKVYTGVYLERRAREKKREAAQSAETKGGTSDEHA